MAVKLLPEPWKPWHPVVFGFLAMIGAMLASPAISFALGLVRNLAASAH